MPSDVDPEKASANGDSGEDDKDKDKDPPAKSGGGMSQVRGNTFKMNTP